MATRITPGSPLYSQIVSLLTEQAEAGSEHARGELAKLERGRKQAKAVASRIKRDLVIRDTPPGSWELWVPDWHPSSANKREGRNRHVADRYKKTDYEIVTFYKMQAGFDLDDRKRRVDAVMRYPNRRHWHDKDNLRKALYDSLQAAHLIYDDDAEWCDQGDIVQEIGDKGTLIRLEDLE